METLKQLRALGIASDQRAAARLSVNRSTTGMATDAGDGQIDRQTPQGAADVAEGLMSRSRDLSREAAPAAHRAPAESSESDRGARRPARRGWRQTWRRCSAGRTGWPPRATHTAECRTRKCPIGDPPALRGSVRAPYRRASLAGRRQPRIVTAPSRLLASGCGRRVARPKSMTLTCPSSVSITFAGFRSR